MTSVEQFHDKALLTTISQEAPFIEFITAVKSAASKRYYPFVLMRYMKFHHFKSTYDMVNRDPKMIQSDISQYILTDNSISRTTMQTYVAVIKCFYIQNDILNINWKKLKSRLGEIERQHQDLAYTPEQINTIIDNGCPDLRSKAVVLLLASSGMRIGALATLLMKHLQYHEEQGVYGLTVYAGSNKEYTAFCSKEATNAINLYLEYRRASQENITPSSPLFREQFDRSDSLRINRPKQVTEARLKKMVYSVVVRAGIRKVRTMVEGNRFGTVRHDIHCSHGFRKFFNTTLANCEINPILLEALMGHSSGLQKNYLRATKKDLLTAYMKAEQSLTIDPANRLEQKVNQLKRENRIIEGKYQKQYRKVIDLLIRMTGRDSEEMWEVNRLDKELDEQNKKFNSGEFLDAVLNDHEKNPD